MLREAPELLARAIESGAARGTHGSRVCSRNGFGRNCSGCSGSAPAAGRWCCPSSWKCEESVVGRICPVPSCERVRRRRAVRGGADVADRARHATRRTIPSGSSTTCRRPRSSNFAGPFGAFLAMASLPAASATRRSCCRSSLGVVGWHYFWCTTIDAGYTKLVGAVPAARRASRACSTLAVQRVRRRARGRTAGGVLGTAGRRRVSRAYLNRTGAAILLLTLLALVGHPDRRSSRSAARPAASPARLRARSAACSTRWRDWREDRRRERERQQIVDKHVKKAGQGPRAGNRHQGRRRRRAAEGRARARRADDEDADDERRAPSRRARPGRPPIERAAPRRSPQPLPLVGRRAAEDAGRTPPGRLRPAAAHAARRAEGSAQDRRARADGRRAAARREVPRVLRRRHGRPDPSRPGRHDLRVQARRRREVQPHHRAWPTTSASRCRPSPS